MQITVNMQFDTGDEFTEWAQAVGLVSQSKGTSDTPETTSPPSPEKRKRRTRKQIAEDKDKGAAVATPEPSPAAEAPPEVVGSITPQPDAPAKEYTLADAVEILRAYTNANGSANVIAKLREYDAGRITEIVPERVSAFLAELVAGTP